MLGPMRLNVTATSTACSEHEECLAGGFADLRISVVLKLIAEPVSHL